jgi:adenine-specific DNA-methyltransferase
VKLSNPIIDIDQNLELGQVWTPPDIAEHMLNIAFQCIDKKNIKILDPACGPATFEKALAKIQKNTSYIKASDVDSRMVRHTDQVIKEQQIKGEAKFENYLTTYNNKGEFDLVIMNPPYIRQELISQEDKRVYAEGINKYIDIKIGKRSNLLIYFLLKSIIDLKNSGILCAIIYDSVLQTEYGINALDSISRYMETISVERVPAPFENTIIDAHILLMRKRNSVAVKINSKPRDLPEGFTELGCLLNTKRGTALPIRKAIQANDDDDYYKFSKKIIIKQNKLDGIVINESKEQAYLIEKNSDNAVLNEWVRERVRKLGKEHASIVCNPICGPILFNYYIRNNPRHFFNPHMYPASDNFYVSNVNNEFPKEAAWLLLNSDEFIKNILCQGRRQGSGLIKLQLYEYKKAVLPDWNLLSMSCVEFIKNEALNLIQENAEQNNITSISNKIIKKYF